MTEPPGVFQYNAQIQGPAPDHLTYALYAEGFRHSSERDQSWADLVDAERLSNGNDWNVTQCIKIDDQNVQTDLMDLLP